MIEPSVPPITPEQAAAQPSVAKQMVEGAANLAIEGGVEAITQSGDLIGGAVAAGVGAVGSLIGGLFESF